MKRMAVVLATMAAIAAMAPATATAAGTEDEEWCVDLPMLRYCR